jgi:protein ImuA
VRNDVPGGAEGLLVPPAGVARAGGTPGRVLIEQLRASIRALEQVPVSLGLPPAPGTAPSRPACSSLSPKLSSPGLTGRSSNPGLLIEALSQPPNQGQGLLDARLRGHDEERGVGKTSPLERLIQAGLHEIKPASYRDTPAALAFALAVIARGVSGPGRRELLLWCLTQEAAREWGHPYGPGLMALGLDPARLLIVEARTMLDAAWALEEGLKSLTLAGALGQAEIMAELAARRLGLAAQASGTPCLLISGHRQERLPGTLTSWRVTAHGSPIAAFDAAAPGAPAWHLTLERCRGAAPGQSLIVEFSHESNGFHLSAASSARAAEEKRQSSYR